MNKLSKQARRAQEKAAGQLAALAQAKGRAQLAAAGLLDVAGITEAAVPAGWKAPREVDAESFARDFQLEHPDVAHVRKVAVPGSKIAIIHVRAEHLPPSDPTSVRQIRATQEEMYRVAAALVERGDVAAGHVENWSANNVGAARKENPTSFYVRRHAEIFVKAGKARVGELAPSVRQEIARGPQTGDAVYGSLVKLYFEGKIALLPSSLETVENTLAAEYAASGVIAHRAEEREDLCLEQALRPEFAPLGNVRLVCDGASHDYLANGRKMGVSVIEITTNSILRKLGVGPDPKPEKAPMSLARKTAITVTAALALGGVGAAVSVKGKKTGATQGAATTEATMAKPTATTDAPRMVLRAPRALEGRTALVPPGFTIPENLPQPAEWVRSFRLGDDAELGEPVRKLEVADADMVLVHIRMGHKGSEGLPFRCADINEVRAHQLQVGRIARRVRSLGMPLVIHKEELSDEIAGDILRVGPLGYVRSEYGRYLMEEQESADKARALATQRLMECAREVARLDPNGASGSEAAAVFADVTSHDAEKFWKTCLSKRLDVIGKAFGEGVAPNAQPAWKQFAKGVAGAVQFELCVSQGPIGNDPIYGQEIALYNFGEAAVLPSLKEDFRLATKAKLEKGNDDVLKYELREDALIASVTDPAFREFGIFRIADYGAEHDLFDAAERHNSRQRALRKEGRPSRPILAVVELTPKLVAAEKATRKNFPVPNGEDGPARDTPSPQK